MSLGTNWISRSQPNVWWKRNSIEEYLGGVLLGVMVVVVFLQVIARYVFGDSFAWSEELARYCFIWLIYVTLGAVVLNAQHITVDAVVSRLPEGMRRGWEQAIQVIILALNIFLIVYGMILVLRVADLGQLSAALQMPMWLVYAAVPVGLLLATVRTVQTSIAIWRPNPENDDLVDDEEVGA
ncbi:TRAP transporter small permease [Kocuria nitroreducens]|uniref:TRAP transporter small permease n=1 Tax=Kocuria nitroreducens TaxID=3058914 RepID=UPI0036DE76B5